MNPLLLKASEIANLTDARYFSSWGVEWLGFCLDASQESYVSDAAFHAMREWLVGPKIVGEFGAVVDSETLHQAIERLKLEAIQIGQFTALEEVAHLEGRIEILKEQVVEQLSDLDNFESEWSNWSNLVHSFILDFEKNGYTWQDLKADELALARVQELCKKFPILISIRFEATELTPLLEILQPQGLSLKGGEEEKVGYKSFDQLDTIYEVLMDEELG